MSDAQVMQRSVLGWARWRRGIWDLLVLSFRGRGMVCSASWSMPFPLPLCVGGECGRTKCGDGGEDAGEVAVEEMGE